MRRHARVRHFVSRGGSICHRLGTFTRDQNFQLSHSVGVDPPEFGSAACVFA
jgi:hypothetical protein